MIQSEALSRLRILYNEVTAGFITDTQAYQFLDSAMNKSIQILLANLEAKRIKDKWAVSVALENLNTLDTSSTTVTNQLEYALPTAPDYLETDSVYYNINGTITDAELLTYPCNRVSFSEGQFQKRNTYLASSEFNGSYYIRGGYLGLLPRCVLGGANCYKHYYYKKPAVIASGTASSEIPTKIETHEAIIFIALSFVFAKDRMFQESEIWYKKGEDILNTLN